MRVIPVTNSILAIGNSEKTNDLTHLKLQKILYFLHGHYLAETGEPLIDDNFEAWPYGPVVPSLYSELKHYGPRLIDEYIFERKTGEEKPSAYFISKEHRPEFWDILKKVWAKYNKYSASQLSSMTHEPGTPWSISPKNFAIDNELIKRHFKNKTNLL